ncbi:RagB/SusD family nutrient uptake outer membrane protein [Flagellimonas oceanensis]|uniref:RagB/SusD family nutrient uptake outer membrane protein n=1 Tax=Flagellimonas oceanensis TaxID=2499163 RepID=UPI003BA9530F
MKNILKYTAIVLGLLQLSSCGEDFLNTEPITELTDESFYSTENQIYTALIGCYDGLQVATGTSGDSGVSFYAASEVMSDDCFGGVGNADGYNYQAIDEFDGSRAPSYSNLFNDTWVSYYGAIHRCNVLINRIDQVDWTGNEDTRNQYLGEARFIRAYLYFEMARLWGGIPLLTEPSSENLPRSSAEEVYAVIAEDLVYAANNMPDISYDTVPNGRVTRWAAKSLLARVYLFYTGYYGQSNLVGMVSQAQALEHLEDVIQGSGHSLVPEFKDLWPAASTTESGTTYAGEDNPEVVFSVKYTFTSDYNGNTDGNHWMVMFGLRNLDHFPYGRGWGITVNPKLYNLYDENDTRRDASVISIEEEEIDFGSDLLLDQREYTGYTNKKYTPMSAYDEEGNLNSAAELLGATNFQIGQFQDYTVIRYADVLLMAAELGSASAQAYFDQVRQRAYGDNFSPLSATPNNIMIERHKEFALEGIRYWDLLRQGIGVAANEIAENTTVLSGNVETNKQISASQIQETQGLSQIPNTQITLSDGVLTQNPGW